jgi:carbamoyltransferase
MWVEKGELRLSPKLYLLSVEFAVTGQLPAYFRSDTPADISAAFQTVLEETQMATFGANLALSGRQKTAVCLSGGTFANVKLNQRFLEHAGVDSVFVIPPMPDEGQPLGAAIGSLQRHDRSHWRPDRLPDVFLGPDFTEPQMEAAIKQANLTYTRPKDMEATVAELLHQGRIVARFAGRMEYGPRALGNRSILAQPTDPAVNDWLNKRLKRTEFMPFAPSVLDTAVDKLFTGPFRKGLYSAEFMTITFDCTPWMRQHCPAVVHVDGTARPQIVTPTSNPSYYRIIQEYEKRSGLPVVINTSFNMHEEPIVCTPADAVRSFTQGHLDVLALGPFLVTQAK